MPLYVDSETPDENIARLYYIDSELIGDDGVTGYKIEYYYSNRINTSKTDIVPAPDGTRIEESDISQNILDNLKTDYIHVRTVNGTLTVKGSINYNIIAYIICKCKM